MAEIENTRALVSALDDPDPLQALAAVAALTREADRIAAVLVRRARNAGCTWAQVAEALGVSRQAVHKRYGR
jgi:hypothetical protein